MHGRRARDLGARALIAGLIVPVYAATSATTATAAISTQADQAEILEAHNDERAAVGMAPLQWSTRLQDSAQQWAEHLAATGSFEHSDSDLGENLWMGTTGAYSDSEKVGSWAAEKEYFLPDQAFPDVSSTGNWQDVGHYTQMIWYNTTTVGCGQASDGENDYLVCHYDPAGNFLGEYPLGQP
jgi:uncharacterized protein YkwD